MNKTKIDWTDMSWNPVTGCLHHCEYCYARGIARRFGDKSAEDGICHFLGIPIRKGVNFDGAVNPFPYGFDPTFHRYRIDEPRCKKKPQNIFVGSMTDLFGEWVPASWIQEVFAACEAAPQHNYLFLTKNPARYLEIYKKKAFPYAENFWYGTTCTRPSDKFAWVERTPYKCFVSIEPILEPFHGLLDGKWPDWIIVGAESGNRKGKIAPPRKWIEDIAYCCRQNDVPIFMKESLRELMGDSFVQEFPAGLAR